MRELWRRRTVRQIVIGLVPAVLIGVGLIAYLLVRVADLDARLRSATNRAEATVVKAGLGDERRQIDFGWTDQDGTDHTSRVTFPDEVSADPGATTILRYDPDDTDRVFVDGDVTTSEESDLTVDVVLVGIVTLAVLVVTLLRVWSRLRAERLPTAARRVRVAHSRRGLVTRSWLLIGDEDPVSWVPVYWDPVLDEIDPTTSYPVHGVAGRHPVPVVEVGDTKLWPSGRRRSGEPRGEISTDAKPRQGGPRRISMARHLRGDGALLVAAPLIGLLWSYVDESGPGGFGGATILMLGVMFWLPALFGSDPAG